MKLETILLTENLTKLLDEQECRRIGNTVVEEFELDCESRQEWVQKSNEWFKLAMQITDDKVWPWPSASNVKYPLLTIAALQFGARAYPILVPSDGSVVKTKVVGYDPTGEKTEQAIKIGKHMSYQLFEEMTGWDEDMDRLLLAVPIIGCMFKKTFYNPSEEKNVSELIYPKDLVVSYFTKNFETTPRATHILWLDKNKVVERQRSDIFDSDVELPEVTSCAPDYQNEVMEGQGFFAASEDDSAPYMILEQHRWLDLDEDGYEEPYIVTVEYSSKKVLRIVKRFNEGNVKYNTSGEIKRIEPTSYFTKFSFIPNPDGGFYDLGFGVLLGPINHTVNTIINQLMDAGTLSNLQSGFIGRGVRLRGGDYQFRPGEWKFVNATGDDLRKNIFPMPVREPSTVLFNLLGMLVSAGKELSTVSEMMVGKTPGQNTPATTTMAAVEQGMKVFTAIYKRLYRGLSAEFKKLYALNRLYLPPISEFSDPNNTQSGLSVTDQDYKNDTLIVIPAADPTLSSELQKISKAEALMQMLQVIPNKGEVIKRVLEAHQQPAIEVLMQAPQPQGPSPDELEHQREMFKLETDRMSKEHKADLDLANAELARTKAMVEAMNASLLEQGQKFDQLLQYLQFNSDSLHREGQTQFDRNMAVSDLDMKRQTMQQQNITEE